MALTGYWSRVLGAVRPTGGVSRPLPRLSSSPRSHPDIVPDLPVRISSVTGSGPGDREDVGQGYLGDHPRSRYRLLQSFYSGGKDDLSHLNGFVRQTPFKMETVASVLLSVQEGFPSFHRPERCIFPNPRSLGIEEAIEVPVRRGSLPVQGPVLRTVGCPSGLHQGACSSLCCKQRLEDRLVLASSEAVTKKNVQDLLSLCHSLGIMIHEEKSDLVPSQTANYLGMTIDTGATKIFLALARVEKFLSVAERFRAMSAPTAQLWQVLLGHLASLKRLVPHNRIRMRFLQWHLKTYWSPESDPPSLPMPLSRSVGEDLSWWMVRDHLLEGVRFGTPAPDLHVYSDASQSRWGAHLLDRVVSGMWSELEKLLHINLLEMKAMFLALQSFQEVTGRHVTAMCDSLTVVAYVNKQGGTVSRSLCLLTSRLLRWTESLDNHLDARYLPGQSNVLTDLLSRRDQVIGTEWSLQLQVATALLRSWGSRRWTCS